MSRLLLTLLMLPWLSLPAVAQADDPGPLVVLQVPDYPPYEYVDERGESKGCFVELYRLVGAKLGREVRFEVLPFSEELIALREGRGHVITGMTDTPERRQHYDFLPGPFREENHLISAVSAPQLQTLADCAGRRIGVVDGEVVGDLVTEAGGTLVVYPDYDSLIAGAVVGEVAHFTTSTEVAFHLLIRRGDIGAFRLSDEPIMAVEFKPAVRKGDAETAAALRRGLDAISQAELDRIAARWLPSHRMASDGLPWGLIALWTAAVLVLCLGLVGGVTAINRQLRRRVAAATAELATVNRTLQGVLDAATDVAIIATDTDGTIRVFNRGAERILGYTAAEMIGRSTPLAFHDEDEVRLRAIELSYTMGRPVSGFETFVAACQEGTGSDMRHWTYIRKDGERRHVEIYVSAMRDEDGSIVGYLGVATDRTRLRDAEEHLARSRKLDALGQLAGGVAHDFNNALAAMMGSAELLEEQLGDRPEERDLARAIVTTAERSAGLTRQLLAFARRASVRSEVVELGRLVAETVELARQTCDPRLRFELSVAGVELPVVGDPGLLQSALLNLLFNARDALDGSGTVRIEARRAELDTAAAAELGMELEAGSYVVVSVHDDGVGIPDDVLPRIFDPFFTTKATGEGTGLGLAAVYGICRDHGGGVGAISEVGMGTSLTLALPVAIGTGVHRPASRPVRGTQRVLVVDDDGDLRAVVAEHLTRLGYTVDQLDDGAAVVSRLTAQPEAYDVLLLDLVMPGMHGTEVLAALRAAGVDLPVVVCSGSLTEQLERDLLAAGAQAALGKPLRMADLTAAIQRVS